MKNTKLYHVLINLFLWGIFGSCLASCCFVRSNLNTQIGDIPHWNDEEWRVVNFEYSDDYLTEFTSATGKKHYVLRGKFTMERTPGPALHIHDINLYQGNGWCTKHAPRRTREVTALIRIAYDALPCYGVRSSEKSTDTRESITCEWRWYLKNRTSDECTMVSQKHIPLRYKPGMKENPAVLPNGVMVGMLYDDYTTAPMTRYVARPVVNLLIDWPVTILGSAAASILYSPCMFFDCDIEL